MITVRLYRHPFAAEAPQVFQAESIGAWLLAHGSPTLHDVFEGEPAAEHRVTGNVAALARSAAPVYTVLEVPGLDPVSWTAILINFAISTVVSLIARSIFAPDKATLDNRTQESPNNALSDRSNRVRVLERVEDIFGTVRAIPSLIMPTYFKYQQNRRVEYALMCVTRGYALVEDVREGDTALESISGASAAVYGPFTSPNSGDAPQLEIGDPISDPVLSVTRSGGVEGVVLKAANQLQLKADGLFMLRGPGPADGGLPATTEDLIWQPADDQKPNIAAVAEVGQAVHIVMDPAVVTRATGTGGSVAVSAATKTYTSSVAGLFQNLVDGTAIQFAGGFSFPNAEPKTVATHTADTVTVVESDLVDDAGVADVTVTMTVDLSGDRVIASIGNGFATLVGPAEWGPLQGFNGVFGGAGMVVITVDNGLTDWTDRVVLPALDATEVWLNVAARQGMYKDNGGSKLSAAVTYEAEIEQLDADMVPTGTMVTASSTLEGSTANERAETLERVTGWTGPARVRVRRVTPYDYDFGGLVVDEITWADLSSVAPVARLHFGNKTIIQTVQLSTPGATAVQNRELNCLCSRLLPTWDGAAFSGSFGPTGALAAGAIYPTSRMVDILAAVTVDPRIGARDIAELDMAQVSAVQDTLDAWHAEVGQFNYTFDRDDLSYEETVIAIATAAFCRPYRQGGLLRLAADVPQAASVAVYTHANTKPGSQTVTRRFASDSDYDGVELVYVDPDSETQETIRLPLDGSYTKLKRVEVSGVRSFAQAWFHAQRAYARLQHERIAQEIVCLGGAQALLPNSRVDIADSTRYRTWAGEVVGQAGLVLTLSRPVEFVAGEPHSILLTHRDGGMESLPVTAGTTANTVVLGAPPAEALVVVPTPEDGVRTVFSLAADSARGAQLWLVQSLHPEESGQYVRLKAVNYAPEYYAADALPVPSRDSVIN